jgi:hypothetical protein
MTSQVKANKTPNEQLQDPASKFEGVDPNAAAEQPEPQFERRGEMN